MASITLRGNPISLKGSEVQVGTKAPEFSAVGVDLAPVTLAASAGKVRVFSVVPSLDTPVCHASTKRWSTEVAALGDDVEVCTVSVDTPFAMKRWAEAERVDNVTMLSDYQARSFGDAYGLTIADGPLKTALARAVIVVDKNDTVAYAEYVGEIANNPDFDAALGAVKAARG